MTGDELYINDVWIPELLPGTIAELSQCFDHGKHNGQTASMVSSFFMTLESYLLRVLIYG